MVTVLPWHDPVRVVENFSLLDHLSGGRAMLGLGRGLGRIEFDGFRVEMGESRRRFTEYTRRSSRRSRPGYIEYDGELYQQPRTEIRPRPLASFKGRTFASAISPQSMDLMAELGVGLMVIAQKPWETVEEELAAVPPALRRAQRRRAAEADPVRVRRRVPRSGRGAADARRLPAALRPLDRRALRVRQRRRSPTSRATSTTPAWPSNIAKHGLEKFNGFLADLQVWGTPDQVTEKLLDYVERTDAGAVLTTLSYGGMPPDVAKANYDLFATRGAARRSTPTTSAATSASPTLRSSAPAEWAHRAARSAQETVQRYLDVLYNERRLDLIPELIADPRGVTRPARSESLTHRTRRSNGCRRRSSCVRCCTSTPWSCTTTARW